MEIDKTLDDIKTVTVDVASYINAAIDETKRRQYIANEAAMTPLTQRLDKIIYLLEILIQKD